MKNKQKEKSDERESVGFDFSMQKKNIFEFRPEPKLVQLQSNEIGRRSRKRGSGHGDLSIHTSHVAAGLVIGWSQFMIFNLIKP